tara:strand:- start:1050 stop:1940 length:891 start_codon:yes stop_codon:yes gene_type:complete
LEKINKDSISCVIVLYKPDLDYFFKNLANHKKNFKKIIIVNNDNSIDTQQFEDKNIYVINNKKNLGIAKALNQGILKSKKLGCAMVTLFDQDTSIDEYFLKNMADKIAEYKGKMKPGLFSPQYKNLVNGILSKNIYLESLRLIRKNSNEIYSYPYFTITSGTIIPVDVLDDVGLMKDELFMDYIDIDWCLRAKKKNYAIISINTVIIHHNLGQSSINIFGHNYIIHSPVRMYYYFRNAILLYKKEPFDVRWKFADFFRNLMKFVFYIIFINNRIDYFRYILKGYFHGIIGRSGEHK